MNKKRMLLALVVVASSLLRCSGRGENQGAWIRINQLGYLPHSIKVAVLAGKEMMNISQFHLCEAASHEQVYSSTNVTATGEYGPFAAGFRLDFSTYTGEGLYYIYAGGVVSPVFAIDSNVYAGCADFMLRYMRQQRCGFNPFLNDSCHTHDGYSVYGPLADGTHIDVIGGWHDAADYLQYVTTSANATFNMLFAYRDNPSVFSDACAADGLPAANGVADVLDEARWGLEWLLKMHPGSDLMFNQIADDRDHAGFRLPSQDSVSYGRGLERPVYFCSGEVQGLGEYKNRTSGVASTAGKFASAFALGAQLYAGIDPDFAALLARRAESAYDLGRRKPGACQTAPCRAPYFYEEDNWVDDMELAAAELYALTGSPRYLADALAYGRQEPVTPWMGADTARHYQWYPFINKGHYELALRAGGEVRGELLSYYQQGIQRVWQRGADTPFLMGVPYIWCSNNLVAAFATQCYLYRRLSGDSSYLQLEAAMRDWLFGCNPWGISMVIGLPAGGVTARDPHSSLSHLYGYALDGGLLDGPVYGSIFRNLQYVQLAEDDEYAQFQSDLVVYHDDVGDYASNEPTMDGTATLIYYLAALAKEGNKQEGSHAYNYDHGAVIRGDRREKELALVFSGDAYADGGHHIATVLAEHDIKGSFFLTGNFYRNPVFKEVIVRLQEEGHYLGAHSDAHLLYCSWQNRDSLLVSKDEFICDLRNNYKAMKRYGVDISQARFFLPPYEWYNAAVCDWCRALGLQLINYTAGTLSHADYTVPRMGERYVSSEKIMGSILRREREGEDGLNGFILLMHIGTESEREDKFYYRLDDLIRSLKERGYGFRRIDELLAL